MNQLVDLWQELEAHLLSINPHNMVFAGDMEQLSLAWYNLPRIGGWRICGRDGAKDREWVPIIQCEQYLQSHLVHLAEELEKKVYDLFRGKWAERESAAKQLRAVLVKVKERAMTTASQQGVNHAGPQAGVQ